MRLQENTKIIMRDAMASTTAFTTNTKSVNMSKYNRCRIMLFITASSTVGDGIVTLKQGTASECDTELAFAEYWHNEACTGDTAGNDDWTRVAATSLTTAGASTATSGYIFEVKSDMFNTDTYGSENRYLRLDLAAGLENATHVAIVYELYEPRDATGGNLPSANS